MRFCYGKRKTVCGIVLAIFTVAASLSAMPARPDVVKAARKGARVAVEDLAVRERAMAARGMSRPQRVVASSGTARILVLLIRYADQSMDAESTPTFYSNLLNGALTTSMSMKKYYSDMSGGKLDLVIDVRGPYTASGTAASYGENVNGNDARPATLVGEAIDQAQADGVDFTLYDNDNNGAVDLVMVIHAGIGEESDRAAPAAIWSHSWDLSSAKVHGDGTGARQYDGKWISSYTIQPEFNDGPGDSTIGVFCHEFGHVLGLPDLYDTTYATQGVGDFSLMAGGSWGQFDAFSSLSAPGDRPSPLLAWEKDRLGWISVKYPDGTSVVANAPRDRAPERIVSLAVLLGLGALGFFSWRRRDVRGIVVPLLLFLPLSFVVLTGGCSDDDVPYVFGALVPEKAGISLVDIEETTGRTAIKIPLGASDNAQYYLIENKVRGDATSWSSALPGSGLLICHVHAGVIAAYFNANAINNGQRIHGVNVVEADGDNMLWVGRDAEKKKLYSDSGLAADLFRSREFTPATTPTAVLYRDTAAPWSLDRLLETKVRIKNISASGSTMTFDYSTNS